MKCQRIIKDKIFSHTAFILTVLICFVLFLIFAGLLYRSRMLIGAKSIFTLLFSSSWKPFKGDFGFSPYIFGTFWVTAVAILIAVPICVLTSIYLSEYSHKKICDIFRPIIDLLAGIPSVIYGLWGVLLIVPLVKNHIAPFFNISSSGYTILSAGIVLAIMIFPIIINISLEVLHSIPKKLREASLALGATKWQTTKFVVLRKGCPGIFAGIVLGISRAFGETMAVLMVAGNVAIFPKSVLDPAYPLPALIANSYGEMMSIPLFDAALMFAALILLIIVVIFNIVSRVVLIKIEESIQ